MTLVELALRSVLARRAVETHRHGLGEDEHGDPRVCPEDVYHDDCEEGVRLRREDQQAWIAIREALAAAEAVTIPSTPVEVAS